MACVVTGGSKDARRRRKSYQDHYRDNIWCHWDCNRLPPVGRLLLSLITVRISSWGIALGKSHHAPRTVAARVLLSERKWCTLEMVNPPWENVQSSTSVDVAEYPVISKMKWHILTPTLLLRSLNIQQFSVFKDREGAIPMGKPIMRSSSRNLWGVYNEPSAKSFQELASTKVPPSQPFAWRTRLTLTEGDLRNVGLAIYV